jgi:molybdate transport system permease protein
MLDWTPILLTLQLAIITTILLFILALPLAYWLAFTSSRLKPLFATIISMPLVLPPTVIGFYLLVAFSPSNWLGSTLANYLGISVLFSFEGLVFASMIYSLPFMVQPIQSGFAGIPANLPEASIVLGKNRLTTLFRVMLPNMRNSIITALVLTFAHTIGEFGVVLMIGGNIPGETRVASIAIYDSVESMNYAAANTYSIILFILAFLILLSVNIVNKGSITRIINGRS